MFKIPGSLKKTRVLLSNDDGIAAPGLNLLTRLTRELCGEVWTVAPELEQSGTGHSLTLRRPLRIRRFGPKRFAVDGTPTDAVLLAINHLMHDSRPDLVLSGINHGGNLGEDVTYSGTIAAAMEATLLGVPAIAFSQLTDIPGPGSSGEAVPGRKINWPVAEFYLPRILRKLSHFSWPRHVFLNVNFPDCPLDQVTGIEITRQGRRKMGDQLKIGEDPRGTPYYWIGSMRTEEPTIKGSDIERIGKNAVTVTPLHLDLTHGTTIKSLKQVFGE